MADEFKTIVEEQEKETVLLNGELFSIGKIGIGKTWRLLTKISGMIAKDKSIIERLKEKKESAFAEVMNIISSLPETTISELVSIVIDKPVEFCDGVGLDELPILIQAIIRHNNVKKILKNWQGVAQEYNKQNEQ